MRCRFALILFFLAWNCACTPLWAEETTGGAELEKTFTATIHPFLQTYCISCHGGKEPAGDLDLKAYSSLADAAKDSAHWSTIVEKLEAAQMPPEKAKKQPSADDRNVAMKWFQAASDDQAKRNAGDPGVVLARRLSNAEYDYTVRDLTGVDLRPAREFPVDPANTAGFDNSGESLTMSPSLLKKQLQAAHEIADHVTLTAEGLRFAPKPMLSDSDREQYCVQRIIDFYHKQNTSYEDYFEAAWRYKHRAALGKPAATLDDVAADRKLSAKYLATVWSMLETEKPEVGPLVKLQSLWKQLPAPAADQPNVAREGCLAMRDFVVQFRKKVEPRFPNISIGDVPSNSEPLLIWKDVQYATHRMKFDPAQLQVAGEPKPKIKEVTEPGSKGSLGPGSTVFINNTDGDPDLVVPAGERERYEAAFAIFCRAFPDRFVMEERGLNYFDTEKLKGRLLSAGFHNVTGYFRDDQPLYELVLSDKQQHELDELWREMDFIAAASRTTYIQFCSSGQRGERGIVQTEEDLGDAGKEVTSEPRMKRLQKSYVAKANGDPQGIAAVDYYFNMMNDNIRWAEKARRDAEPAQLPALLQFAARAFRRPLSKEEQDDVLADYQSCRKSGLEHEEAIREGIVSLLMSPDFCFRIDLLPAGKKIQPLSDFQLASRLSFFLWSSMPDDELLARAAAGDLHQPAVLAAQAKRMLKDAKVRALAVEFGGNWLDFRRFDELATVDRERFPTFTPELRAAMYEEPIHFLVDAFQTNRSVRDLLDADYTFVNPALAKHYGIPTRGEKPDAWTKIGNATEYGRGGLLGMAAFMTKNSPGLRTSPVKRGNWVVKNILGERIAPPPPNVPELPKDEAKLDLPLREMLARHRQDANCAACHARFDSFGLVFEGFGPVGERREKDLAGRAVDVSATFPAGGDYAGLDGLRRYIRDHRQSDFEDNFCRKLLAFALGRSLILSDQILVRQMRDKLAANDYRVDSAVESIVTSPQFLNKRGE